MCEIRITANPEIVLREEFDQWAILFNPENGQGFGINPVGVYIWKLLDGKNTIPDIVQALKTNCDDVPAEAEIFVREYIDSLFEKGLAGERL